MEHSETMAGATVRRGLDSMKEAAVDAADKAQAAAVEQFNKLESSIRKDPIPAVGIAALAGLVLALVVRR